MRSSPPARRSLIAALLTASPALILVLTLAGCPEPPPPRPPGPRFTVVLTAVGEDRAAVVAAVASIRGSRVEIAEKIVARIETARGTLPIAVGVDREAADRAAAALRAAGGEALLQPVP